MKHSKWFERTTGADSALNAAKTARPRLNNATLSRQFNKGQFSAEVVIALARGYGQSPVEALAQTGYIEAEEVTGIDREALADLLTDQEMIRALAKRIDSDESAWEGTFSEVVDNVSHLPSNNQGEDTTPAVHSSTYGPHKSVAYNGPDEDQDRHNKEDGDYH